MTVSQLLDEYVNLYGLNHWSESTLSSTMHRITHYINPYIGAVPIKSLTTHRLERFYRKLLREPAVCTKGKEHLQTTIPLWKKKSPSTTTLVLKTPKTESSVRTIYLPPTVIHALRQAWEHQMALKNEIGSVYQDFNLVVARDNGRPFEEHNISEKLKALIQTNNLRPVVFHSLRHSSTSLKLKISGGDIKAVQDDTRHAQAPSAANGSTVFPNIPRKQKNSCPTAHEFFHETADSAAKKFAGDCRSASANVSHFERQQIRIIPVCSQMFPRIKPHLFSRFKSTKKA